MTWVEYQRQALINDVYALKLSIIDRYRRLNALTPICRLPPEILAEIFLYCAATWLDDLNDEEWTADPYEWTYITHVCHYWRAVARNTPRLWSNIVEVTSPEFMHDVFALSKQATLHIEAPIGDDTILQFITNEMHRIATLHLNIDADIESIIALHPATKLENLKLTFPPDQCGRRDIIPFDENEMPKLKHLELLHCDINWTNRIFRPTLTHLTITSTRGPSYSRYHPDVHEVLGTLEQLSQLQCLTLDNSIPDIGLNSPVPDPIRLVSLPHLEALALKDTCPNCLYFLQHLSYPTTTLLSIHSETVADELATAFASVVIERIGGVCSTSGTAQTLRTISIRDGRFKAWTIHLSVQSLAPEHCPPNSLLDLHISGHDLLKTYGDFCAAMPMDTVETFDFAPSSYVSPEEVHLRRLFDHLTAVRELALGRFMECVVTHILALRLPGPAPILPNLKTLLLHDISYRSRWERPLYWEKDKRVQMYLKVLKISKERGVPLARLIIDRCVAVGHTDVGELKGFVSEVDYIPARAELLEKPKPSWVGLITMENEMAARTCHPPLPE